MTQLVTPQPTAHEAQPLSGWEVAGLAFKLSLFFGVHVAAVVLALVAGLPSWQVALFALGTYAIRMFGITAGYHRYFSHKTFKTSRPVAFLLGLTAVLSLQKGVLWWAAHHRWHHRYSDEPQDVHSPIQRGLWWAHVGWILDPSTDETRWDQIKDLSRYPELRLLNSHTFMIAAFAVCCALTLWIGGLSALTWGCFVSTLGTWHATFAINSLTHVWGKRVYATSDESRNSLILALITLGEGWHNNHHYYQTSCPQGFRWYEIDITYRALWVLEKLGLVWDVRRPSPEVVAGQLGRREWRIDAAPPEPAPVVSQAA